MNTNFNKLLKSNALSNLETAGGSYGIGKASFFFNPSEKSLKFKKIAEKRMSDSLKGFQLISNLSNKSNYEYTAEQVEQIIEVIELEIENIKLKFANLNQKSSVEFTFK